MTLDQIQVKAARQIAEATPEVRALARLLMALALGKPSSHIAPLYIEQATALANNPEKREAMAALLTQIEGTN